MIIKIKAVDKKIKSISNFNDNIKILYQDAQSLVIKATSKDDDCLMIALNKFFNTKFI